MLNSVSRLDLGQYARTPRLIDRLQFFFGVLNACVRDDQLLNDRGAAGRTSFGGLPCSATNPEDLGVALERSRPTGDDS